MVIVSSIERDYLSGRSVALFTAKKNVERIIDGYLRTRL